MVKGIIRFYKCYVIIIISVYPIYLANLDNLYIVNF